MTRISITEIDDLCYKIREQNHAAIDRLLIKGEDYSQVSSFGLTPLLAACLVVDPIIVEKLLDHGASPNQSGKDKPPLIYALSGANYDNAQEMQDNGSKIVDLLLSAGADVNYRDPETNQSSLMAAQHPDHLKLILRYAPNLDTQDDAGDTVLHQTLSKISLARDFKLHTHYSHALKKARLLLNHGANIDLKNNQGDTVRNLIDQSQNDDVASLLPDTSRYQAAFNQKNMQNGKKIAHQYGNQNTILLKRRTKRTLK